MNLSPELFIEICEHWRQAMNDPLRSTLPSAQLARFNDLIDYLERNFALNSRDWSKMIIPENTTQRNMFYANSTNGIESLNRALNRHVRDYAKNNLTVVGKYIIDFYKEQIEVTSLIEKGERLVDLSKISKVSIHDILVLKLFLL